MSQWCCLRQLNPWVWNVFRENTIPSQIKVAIQTESNRHQETDRQTDTYTADELMEKNKKRKSCCCSDQREISFINYRFPMVLQWGLLTSPSPPAFPIFLDSHHLVSYSFNVLCRPFPCFITFLLPALTSAPHQLTAKVELGSACSSCEGADKQKSFRRSRLSVQLWFM